MYVIFFFLCLFISDEEVPLLGGNRRVSAWRQFLQGLVPIDREDWSKSNYFWKFFMIIKVAQVLYNYES